MATARWWIAERVAGAAREAVSPTARRGLARERAARPHRPAVASSPDEPAGRGGGEGIRRAPTRGGLRVYQAGGAGGGAPTRDRGPAGIGTPQRGRENLGAPRREAA